MMIDDLRELNKRVCLDLWRVAHSSKQPSGLSPKLIFPNKRDSQNFRISEQAARFLYCNNLSGYDYYYSIETPSTERYCFTGDTARSASSDLTLYRYSDSDFKKLANIEFKALNPKQSAIDKDVEKLIRERVTGNWFHVFKNADDKTIQTLFDKFKEAFREHEGLLTECSHSIIFCICVYEQKWSAMQVLDLRVLKQCFEKVLDHFFKMDFFDLYGRRFSIKNLHGWEAYSL